jgi:8-oxo-dGTP pyrophosphatase MutT (NUDIX family)
MSQKFSTVAVINRDKKILLLKRGPTAPYNPNNYCFPGGTVEHNESLEEAASRELSEETGINFHKDHLEKIKVTYPSGYNKIIFVAMIDDAEVRLNYEHTDYAWVNSSESSVYPMVDGLRVTIDYLVEKDFLS